MNNDGLDSALKERKQLRIFISYAHADDGKVNPIKDGLGAQGYEVWFDRENIHPGDIWRKEIGDGIRKCDVFIAFLSENSMKNNGVCLDEIQFSVGIGNGCIKTILLEPEDKVHPPATIAHTQWLDLSKWNGASADLPKILDDICTMVERGETYIQADEIDVLRRIMNPVDCEARKRELCSRQMFGRKWLYEALRKWDAENRSNIFWLSGGAGFGKSMFAVNLCSAMSEKVVAAHFVEWNNPGKNDAASILKSLAFQLARRYPDYRKFIISLPHGTRVKLFSEKCDPDVLCDELFCEQAGLCIDGKHETAWVLIDALDEATRNGKNPVAGMIAQYRDRFPKWLKFIITSRDDAAVRTALGGMKPDIFYLDDKIVRYQKEDMKAFLNATLAECAFDDSVYESLIAKSEGMFLYLRYACETVLEEKLNAQGIRDLPNGITGIYNSYFERHFGRAEEDYTCYDEKIRPILEVYSAAYEVLTLDFFAAVENCDIRDIRNAIARLGTLKNDRKVRQGGREKETFQLCHKSVWDWLTDLPDGEHSFKVTREAGAKSLTDFCLKKIKEYKMEQIVKDENMEYPLRYVIRHLAEQRNESAIWELLGGTEPQLPKLQKDCFGSYAASVDSLKTAVLFYMELYRAGNSSGKVLSRLCRLMVTLASLQVEQQKELKKIFAAGNSLQETLDFMDCIQDVKVYYYIGCYLLTKVEENHWNMEQLISAIEKKCSGNLESIDSDETTFLGKGVLPKIIHAMSAVQIIRLFRVFSDRYDAKRVMDELKDQMNLPQAARAYWYFDKLQDAESGRLGELSSPEKERERIQKIEDADKRCEELLDLAVNYYVHEDLPTAEQLLAEAIDLLKEADSRRRLEQAAELYWNMGKTTEAGQLILEHREIYGERRELDFINDLCRYGLPEKGYAFFETHILPDTEESAEFLKQCVSPLPFLLNLAENGKGETILSFADAVNNLAASDFASLLETMIRNHQEAAAAGLLKTICAREEKADCLFQYPKLLSLMRELKNAGVWTEAVPDERALKAEYLKRHKLEKLSDYRKIQDENFSPDFQLELLRDARQIFSAAITDPALSAKGKADLVCDMNHLLTLNSSGLQKQLAPEVEAFLDKLKELSQDRTLFLGEGRHHRNSIIDQIEDWICGSDTLLRDTLEEGKIAEFVNWFDQKISEAMEDANCDVEDSIKALFRYYVFSGQSAEFAVLLGKIHDTDTEKLKLVLDSFVDIFSFGVRKSERKNIPLPLLPDGLADEMDFVFRSIDQKSIRLGDVDFAFSNFMENLEPYRTQETAVRICSSIWHFLDPVFDRTRQKDMRDACRIMEGGAWSMPDEQFFRWFAKIGKAADNKDCWTDWEDCLPVFIKYQTGKEHPDKDWPQKVLAEFPKIKDLSEKNTVLAKLLAAVIRNGSPEQQQEILTSMSNTALIGNYREFRELDLEKFYSVLTGGSVSDAAIHSIVKEMNWEDLDFDKLCLIAPNMLDEKEYMGKWISALFRKLQEAKDLDTMAAVIADCPELGLPELSPKEPEKTPLASVLTPVMVAGMMPAASPLAEQIMELRRQLAGEIITAKGYRMGMEALLAPLPEEKRQKIAALEQSLEDGLITEKGFGITLSGIIG